MGKILKEKGGDGGEQLGEGDGMNKMPISMPRWKNQG